MPRYADQRFFIQKRIGISKYHDPGIYLAHGTVNSSDLSAAPELFGSLPREVEVDCGVPRQQLDYVFEDRDAGGDLRLAGAVEVDRDRDVGLGGLAGEGGATGFHWKQSIVAERDAL